MVASEAIHFQPISVQVAKGYFLIREGEETRFIDYEEGVLYHRPGDGREVKRFHLDTPEADSFLASQVDIFSELKVLDKEATSENEFLCTVIKAPRATLTKIAGQKSFTYWGQKFETGISRYLVHQEHPLYRELKAIAVHNRGLAGFHPLLLQIDPSLLVEVLEGVPVEKREKEKSAEILFSLQSEDNMEESLNSLLK